MATLKLTGVNLHYETTGNGPLLILIPGANGTGDIFAPVSQLLADKFTVLTYDRRGFGASELTEALPDEAKDSHSTLKIQADAQDIKALKDLLSPEQKVYIMGSSSGSIVAMEVLQEFPEIVEKIAFHEPPVHTFMPTAEKDAADNDRIVAVALDPAKGLGPAMQLFAQAMNMDELDAKMMAKPAVALAGNDSPAIKNVKFWTEYEIRQYTNREINLDLFKENRSKISLLNGTDSRGIYPQGVNVKLAEILDLPIFSIPGGHLGYAQKPEGFATTLAAVFLANRA